MPQSHTLLSPKSATDAIISRAGFQLLVCSNVIILNSKKFNLASAKTKDYRYDAYCRHWYKQTMQIRKKKPSTATKTLFFRNIPFFRRTDYCLRRVTVACPLPPAQNYRLELMDEEQWTSPLLKPKKDRKIFWPLLGQNPIYALGRVNPSVKLACGHQKRAQLTSIGQKLLP